MGKNSKYLLENLDFEIPISFWITYLDNFLGKDKAEEFYEYLIKDTYQREYLFIIFSEENSNKQFQKNITELCKKYNIEEVLITDNMKDRNTRMQLNSNIIDVSTGKVKETIKDTTIDTVESYLSNISGTKVLFKIPYENNKTILNKDVNYLNVMKITLKVNIFFAIINYIKDNKL